MDKRLNQIQALINQLASGNFDYKISPSESQDELDAVILGINMLGEELKSSQDKYATLFEHVDDAILIFDINSNKFVDSNQTATKLLGFSKEDILQLSLVDLLPKEESASVERKITYLKSVVQTKFDTQIKTKAGELNDVSFLSKKLPYGGDQYFQISLRDITEAKQISNDLVKKNTELVRAQKEIGELLKFPSENPNPILRFNEKNKLLYNNAVSTINFLSDFKIKEDKLNDRVLKDYLNRVKSVGGSETFIETRNKRHYSLTLVYVQEFNYINIYATDISELINQVNEKETKLIGLNAEIENQKAFYELILNSLPSDVAVFDDNHRYLFVNPQGIQDKKTRKFMIGKDDFDYVKFKGVSDEKAVLRRKMFKKIMKTKLHETWTDEFVGKNGSRKVVQRSMGPIFDEKGKFCFVIGYGVDITKRIETEEENLKLALVAKNTNNGVLMLNKDREITWANSAFLKRSGYSLSEVIGEDSVYYLFDDTNDPFIDKVLVAMDRQEKFSGELVRRSKKGEEYWIDLNIQPLFDSANNLNGFMFVEFDITDSIINNQTIQNLNMNLENLVEQKTKKLKSNEVKLENSLIKEKERTIALRTSEKKLKKSLIKEKELSQLKASFVTVASHQFRTPLAVIQSNTELLGLLSSKGEKQDSLRFAKINNRITEAISKMTALMDDVLTLGKVDSGKVNYAPQKLDLVKFCEKLSEEFNSVQIDGRCISLVLEGEPYDVHLDANLLVHTLSNLISNAFKYSREKRNPELLVQFKSAELVLSVKDYGLGISQKEQLHLFEPFFRANNATEIQGTGLGLSIAKEYVEINRGSISARSKLGEGSCFEIIFKKDKI